MKGNLFSRRSFVRSIPVAGMLLMTTAEVRAQMVDDLRAQLAEVSGRAADLMAELEGLPRRKGNKARRHELARHAEQARSHAEALSFEIDRLRRECEQPPFSPPLPLC